MATIHKIVHRPDGKIGVWSTPKIEHEFNDLQHLRLMMSGPSASFEEAAFKQLVLQQVAAARSAAEAAKAQPITIDLMAEITKVISADEVKK